MTELPPQSSEVQDPGHFAVSDAAFSQKPGNAYALALVAVLSWSTAATAFKLGLRSLDVSQLLLYANLSAAVFLMCYVVFTGRIDVLRDIARNDWLRCLGLGLLNPLAFYLVLLGAYDRLPAQIAQPLNFTWAITLSLLAVPLLGQRIGWRDWVAAGIAYCGVLVITLYGKLPGGEEINLVGIALALGSTIIWSLYWIFNTRAKGDAACRLALNFLFALPASLMVCVFSSDPLAVDPSGLAAAVWVGVFEMGLPFLAWQLALSLSNNAARISTLVFLSPFLSLQLIHRVLGEPILPSTYAGLVLILIGLFIQRR